MYIYIIFLVTDTLDLYINTIITIYSFFSLLQCINVIITDVVMVVHIPVSLHVNVFVDITL